jgi:hypothetical protein
MISRHTHLRQRCTGVVGSNGDHFMEIALMSSQCGFIEEVVDFTMR